MTSRSVIEELRTAIETAEALDLLETDYLKAVIDNGKAVLEDAQNPDFPDIPDSRVETMSLAIYRVMDLAAGDGKSKGKLNNGQTSAFVSGWKFYWTYDGYWFRVMVYDPNRRFYKNGKAIPDTCVGKYEDDAKALSIHTRLIEIGVVGKNALNEAINAWWNKSGTEIK